MKKIVFILLVFLSVSCSTSVDRTIVDPNSNNLKSFAEPNLEFGITKTDLYAKLGQPERTRSNGTTLGFDAIYKSSDNGIFEIAYELDFTSVTQTEQVLTDVEITFWNDNKTTLDFMLNWLKNKYGTPKFSKSSGQEWYDWNTTNYKIKLSYFGTPNNLSVLTLKYSGN